jgi:uncharacterized membrane protein
MKTRQSRLGLLVFGVAAIAAGIVNLHWHDFTMDQQPIQAFGDRVSGREAYALITAVWLILGGLALFWRRTASAGAVALGVVYFIFASFWISRFRFAPLVGFKSSIILGILDGIGEQLILVAAAVIIWALLDPNAAWAPRLQIAARWTFGLSCIVFGINHFTGLGTVAAMIPSWMPLPGAFWAVVTGAAFILAGVAILTGILGLLASRLLALMLLVFSVIALLPMIFAAPGSQASWGNNTFNLAAVGAAWILSDWFGSRQFRKPDSL